MINIDWGDLQPTSGQRALVEARVSTLGDLEGPVVALRKRGHGYEATLQAPCAPAELRLQGDDLANVVERAVHLLSIVVRPPS
jgi:hypothetical protein